MGEKAVLDLPLADRPTLDLTDQEIRDIYKGSPTGTAKILKNQARWNGYADIAEAVKQGYQDYLRALFGGGKTK